MDASKRLEFFPNTTSGLIIQKVFYITQLQQRLLLLYWFKLLQERTKLASWNMYSAILAPNIGKSLFSFVAKYAYIVFFTNHAERYRFESRAVRFFLSVPLILNSIIPPSYFYIERSLHRSIVYRHGQKKEKGQPQKWPLWRVAVNVQSLSGKCVLIGLCVFCFLNFNREKESNDLFSHAVGTFLKMLFLTQVVS